MQMVVVPVVNTFPRIKIKNINEGLTVIRTAQPAIKGKSENYPLILDS